MKKLYKAIFYSSLLVVMKVLVYFTTKFFIHNPHLMNRPIDNSIPFISHFIYFYYLWYAFLFIIPTLLYLKNTKYFKRYLLMAIIGTFSIAAIYIIYPSTIIRADFTVTNISDWLVDLMYKIDYPILNCFPSGHCYYALVFIFCTYNVKEIKMPYRILIASCSTLICLATLFIKQHVLIDFIGSIGLISVIIPIVLLIEKKKN